MSHITSNYCISVELNEVKIISVVQHQFIRNKNVSFKPICFHMFSVQLKHPPLLHCCSSGKPECQVYQGHYSLRDCGACVCVCVYLKGVATGLRSCCHCNILHEGYTATQYYHRHIKSSLSEISAGWLTLANPFHCRQVKLLSLVPYPPPSSS